MHHDLMPRGLFLGQKCHLKPPLMAPGFSTDGTNGATTGSIADYLPLFQNLFRAQGPHHCVWCGIVGHSGSYCFLPVIK